MNQWTWQYQQHSKNPEIRLFQKKSKISKYLAPRDFSGAKFHENFRNTIIFGLVQLKKVSNSNLIFIYIAILECYLVNYIPFHPKNLIIKN